MGTFKERRKRREMERISEPSDDEWKQQTRCNLQEVETTAEH